MNSHIVKTIVLETGPNRLVLASSTDETDQNRFNGSFGSTGIDRKKPGTQKSGTEPGFEDSIFVRKVGNGASFKFWEETWHGNTSFKDTYPRLYALESSKSCNINEMCYNSNDPLTRSWAWSRPMRLRLEMEQCVDLTNLLLTFDITNCPDSWVCSIENNKPYLVYAMRKVIEGCIIE
ncbi:hypothetical protein CTI12_AA129350 [Artemisia annua]|uniref:RNA-directed DNA polymerase, eukaryota, Reverse transcriptase zinc-binding domain protein n=1 Tax=Artemisia annua TaxID=35608 RepID=A0A2U1PP46_ARTAN|nr:hypothetical protein CTI12_AA129350 [Artemisia annua]